MPSTANPNGTPRSWPVTVLFLLTLVGVPVVQAAWELERDVDVQALDAFGPLSAQRLRRFDDELRESSFLQRVGVRWYQAFLVRWLGHGNEKAVVGRGGWLYYRDDLDFVAHSGGLERHGQAAVEGMMRFRDQLAERGIPLLVVLMLPKGVVDADHLSRWAETPAFVDVSGLDEFYDLLQSSGVDALDLRPLLRPGPGDEPAYMPRDTHWTPATMKHVAAHLAREVEARLDPPLERVARWHRQPTTVSGLGDIVAMLQLPVSVQPFEPMQLEAEQVVDVDSGAPFESDPAAEVLLLGDSFSGVFSNPRFGLGAGAGLPEHLAAELGAPLDVIALAGGSSRGARESLARRAGGLDGKRIVVWQLSLRELSGDPDKWGRVELPVPGTIRAPQAAGGKLVVEAEITEVSRVPEGFDYPFCLTIYEYRVERTVEGDPGVGPLWVAHVGMLEFEATPAAELQVGQRVHLELEPLEEHHDLEETSWIDDTNVGRRIWFPTAWEPMQ